MQQCVIHDDLPLDFMQHKGETKSPAVFAAYEANVYGVVKDNEGKPHRWVSPLCTPKL